MTATMKQRNMRLSFILVIPLVAFLVAPPVTCFVISSKSLLRQLNTKYTLLMASPKKTADFEYQELKIQLNAMKEQEIASRQLPDYKRNELEGYARRVVNRRDGIPLYEIAGYLPNTKWRLAFTTQSLASDLPKDANVYLEFHDDKTLDYILEFTKTLGLKRLTAKSSYEVDSSPLNPGLVTYTYEQITTDIFGFSNIGVGTMGMLAGRSSYIPTVYFDNEVWIERGMDTGGQEYFSVYIKEQG